MAYLGNPDMLRNSGMPVIYGMPGISGMFVMTGVGLLAICSALVGDARLILNYRDSDCRYIEIFWIMVVPSFIRCQQL